MELEIVQKIARISDQLARAKAELVRYNKENYLHDTKGKTPWISVKIGNHPTYLSDFIVRINDDDMREKVVRLAIQQIKMTIMELEKELAELLKKGIE
jgi:hypothetical protein